MSDTIQTRDYSGRQAALLQQRPSQIIETAENRRIEHDFLTLTSRVSEVIYESGQSGIVGERVVDTRSLWSGSSKALPASTKMMFLSVSLPTASSESDTNLDDALDDFIVPSVWTRWAGQAKEALQKPASKVPQASTAAAHFRVKRLATLQAAFGFTTQDLAAVLRISRQQLYNWLDASNDVTLQEASRVRLFAIERIAKEWASCSKAPLGSMGHEELTGGATTFAMLSAEAIDDDSIVNAFGELIAKLQAKPKTRSQRLREAGFTRRLSALPSDE